LAKKPLPVACAIDREYAAPLLVTLISAVEYLDPGCEIQLYLSHENLDERTIARISQLVDVHIIEWGRDKFDVLRRHHRYPAVAAFPLLLPELLPSTLDRVLFLDADLLILDDLARLWEVSTAGRALAAAPDGAIHLCSSPRGVKFCDEWGVAEGSTYFNCGVMLIDLEAWRNREVTRRACNYLNRAGDQADFLHQQALNAVLWSDWQRLDQRWNLLASVAGRAYGQPASGFSETPGIVHFAGRFKPWRAPVGGPYYAQYREFLSKALQGTTPVPGTLRDHILSLYDRYLRDSLYRCERVLWNHGLF